MKNKKEEKKEDVVYVGIEDPASVRRGILEASKSLVHVLKGQHSLKDLRAEKHKLIEELRGRITAINAVLTEAKTLLPEAATADIQEEEKPKKSAVIAAPKAPPKPAPIPNNIEHHMDRFEKELRDIENKLKTL